jgi:serine phosphatase RsbU (regulator of sigma subunit)
MVMQWQPFIGLEFPALLIPFVIAGIGICLSFGVAALAYFGGPRCISALAGAIFAASIMPFAFLFSQGGFASWFCGVLLASITGLVALYEYLRMRGENQGSGTPQLFAVIAMALSGLWIPLSAVLSGAALNFGAGFVGIVAPGLVTAGIVMLQKKRKRIEEANALVPIAATALIAGGILLALGLSDVLPGPLAATAYVVAAMASPALFAGTSLGGKGKTAAVTNNRVLKLTAKSLENENRQLSDMAARLEFERNRLQERRTALEKENKQAEERIKELCLKADAFFALGQSIDYARRIQQALIPSENKLRATMGDAFLLNLPRDKVSGDFLWCMKFDDGWSLLCVADSTGHGVPGAFMSALGTMLLGQIVTERTIRRPDQVLAAMDRNLRSALSSNGGDIQDGMEAAIVLISPSRNQAIFCGAKRGLYRASNGQCVVIEGIKRPIGGKLKENAPAFESVTVPLRKDEMLYLASDGYQDQLGGPDTRRYLSRRFNDTLAWISALPVKDQRGALLSSHNQWKAGRDQTDDIIVVGLKV